MSSVAPAAPPSRPIGAHVRVSAGLAAGGLAEARALGAEAIQVFAANPRAWAAPAPDPRQDAAFAARRADLGLPLFVHAPYLINPGSADSRIRQRSGQSLAHSLGRGAALGALGVVVHTGSATDGDRAAGLRRVREVLLPLLDSLPEDAPDLLLEPTAGQADLLCGQAADLGPYLEALDWHPRAGLCLDTCHAFAAGHDLTVAGGVGSLLTALAQAGAGGQAGPAGGRLRLIHANDSKDPCGSRRDRHQNIGSGQLGTGPFLALLHHPATAGIPFIIETPGPDSRRAADVATLKTLRDRPPPEREHLIAESMSKLR